MSSYSSAFEAALPLVTKHIQVRAVSLAELPTLPTQGAIDASFAALAAELPEEGWGTERTTRHLLEDVVGGLATGQAGPHVRPVSAPTLDIAAFLTLVSPSISVMPDDLASMLTP